MPYTQPHQYTLMPNILQMRPGQSKLMTTFREFQNAKHIVYILTQNDVQEEAAIVTYSYNMILKVTFGWLHCRPRNSHFLFSCMLALVFSSSNLLFPFWIIN